MSFRLPSVGQIARNNAADAAKIALDSSFWKPFVAALAKYGWIPKTLPGRLAAIEGMSVLGAVAQVNLGENTLVPKVLNEVVSDLASEVGGRILRMPPGQTAPQEEKITAGISAGIKELTDRLNRWSGR